ncbi:Carbohydrate-binding X8 domain superfamily protein isoform 2 [Theobroma cacao]|uniref:Carbohydrate-binding X8 domain superfamily protein isoform 2 n=1 Tax=Theobroma cacao TaxID=3641 RepID=A0A061EKV0_THECC|nr:Carbohydrate-binding X8 domain superfamily protein isoform 2 [Theobroma cacao]
MHVPLVQTVALYSQVAFVFFPTLSRLMLLMLSIATTSVWPWHLVPVILLALPLLPKLIPVMDLVCTHLLQAGGIPAPTPPATVINNPNVPMTPLTTIPINGDGSTGLNNPGLTPPVPTTDESKASLDYIVATSSMSVMLLLVLSFILHPMWIS